MSGSSRSAARTTKVLANSGDFFTPSQYSKSRPVPIHSARRPSQRERGVALAGLSARCAQVGQPASTYFTLVMSTPCTASIGSTIDCQAAEPSRMVLPSSFLRSLVPSPLRKARLNVSSAPMWKTDLSFMPFSSAKEKTPGDGKPMSAWPTSTNFTVAVPSDGPGCMSVSTPRSAK